MAKISGPVDFSKLGDDEYIAGLAPSQLLDIVQAWDRECHNRLGRKRAGQLSEDDFSVMTYVVMMIVESLGIDSNAILPAFAAMPRPDGPALLNSEWDSLENCVHRLEVRLRLDASRPSREDAGDCLRLDVEHRVVHLAGQAIDVTPRQTEILVVLIRAQGGRVPGRELKYDEDSSERISSTCLKCKSK